MRIVGERRKLPVTIFVWLLAFIWIIPLWATILASLKDRSDYLHQTFWELPTRLGLWDNINLAVTRAALGLGLRNSLLYGLGGAVLAVLIASLAAYSITRLTVKFRMLWFFLIFSGTIFPFQMYLIPLFKLYINTGLYDTQLGMLGFYTAIATPFCLFVMRNFLITVPGEIQEAGPAGRLFRLESLLADFHTDCQSAHDGAGAFPIYLDLE